MAKPNREDAVAVAVPIRSFSGGKERLSSTLSVGKRSALARRMSDNLLRAVQSFHVVVVTNDAEVQDWAYACGAHVLSPEVTGLNAAAEAAHAWADAHNKTQLVIVHSDVPQPRALPTICNFRGFTIVPDHRRDGTNVLSIPVDISFRFNYGTHSFPRHLQEAASAAQAHNIPLRVVHHHELGLDLDTPLDLTHPLASLTTKDSTS